MRRAAGLAALLLPLLCASAHAGTQALTPQFVDDMFLGDRRALVIGVSSYTGGWRGLPGAGDDAAAVAAALRSHGYTVELVTDPKRTTGAEIKRQLAAFLAAPDRVPGRPLQLLVYYAGHGETCFARNRDEVRKGRAKICPDSAVGGDVSIRGFLVPSDAPRLQSDDRESFANFAAKAIDVDRWLRELIPAVPQAHVLFAFDSCFSGTIVNAFAMQSAARRPRHGRQIWQLASEPSIQILTAGNYSQEVPDRSIFREAFTTALTGQADYNGDGYVTGTELAQFVRAHVQARSAGTAYPTTPQFVRLSGGSLKGEFLFRSFFGPTALKLQTAREDDAATARLELRYPNLYEFRDCPDCPRMVALPEGRYFRGSNPDEAGRAPGEADATEPRAATHCDRFAMGKYEVSFAEWDACFQEGGCQYWPDDRGLGRGRRPVSGIALKDAQDYTQWLSAKTERFYSVPDELAWEYAARGGVQNARPWGNEAGVGLADCDGCGSAYDGRQAAPAGLFPENDFGLYDVIGNVWEWACKVGFGDSPKGGCTGVLRGGAYTTSPKGARLAVSAAFQNDYRQDNVGFRVVRRLGAFRDPDKSDKKPAAVCRPIGHGQ